MSIVPSLSDYRLKLNDYYDEIQRELDIFVEQRLGSTVSESATSRLNQQREVALKNISSLREKNLKRLDDLYSAKAVEAETSEDVLLINDRELFNNSTLILLYDEKLFLIALINLVDQYLTQDQVKKFKLLYSLDQPDVYEVVQEYDDFLNKEVPVYALSKTATEEYMNQFCLNYTFTSDSFLKIRKKTYERFLDELFESESRLATVESKELFKIDKIHMKHDYKKRDPPVLIRPDAKFLFEYAECVLQTDGNPQLIVQFIDSIELKSNCRIEVVMNQFKAEADFSATQLFEAFKGKSLTRIMCNINTSLVSNRFFYGLELLEELEFGNRSKLFELNLDVFKCLPNLKRLCLREMKLDLCDSGFITSKTIEDLSFVDVEIKDHKVDPNLLDKMPNLNKLTFRIAYNSRLLLAHTTPENIDLFSSFGHSNISHLNIEGYRIDEIDSIMFKKYPNLSELSVVSTGLKSVKELPNSSSLKSIKLTDYKIKDFNFLNKLTSLNELHLYLPGDNNENLNLLAQPNFSSLKELFLHSIETQEAVDVSNMVNLESLDLKNTKLKTIPFKGRLPSLKRFNLELICLKTIEPSLFVDLSMPKIVSLALSYNKPGSILPSSFASLSSLELLVIEPQNFGLQFPLYDWPPDKENLLQGLANLKAIKTHGYDFMDDLDRFPVFVPCLNKFVNVYVQLKSIFIATA